MLLSSRIISGKAGNGCATESYRSKCVSQAGYAGRQIHGTKWRTGDGTGGVRGRGRRPAAWRGRSPVSGKPRANHPPTLPRRWAPNRSARCSSCAPACASTRSCGCSTTRACPPLQCSPSTPIALTWTDTTSAYAALAGRLRPARRLLRVALPPRHFNLIVTGEDLDKAEPGGPAIMPVIYLA